MATEMPILLRKLDTGALTSILDSSPEPAEMMVRVPQLPLFSTYVVSRACRIANKLTVPVPLLNTFTVSVLQIKAPLELVPSNGAGWHYVTDICFVASCALDMITQYNGT